MNSIKKVLGFVWMLLAPVVIIVLVSGAWMNIDAAGTKDINQPVPWIIIIGIFTPIAMGLFIFGWYCVKGEYAKLPESSIDI
jgi:Na+/H+ antiporter NhaA